MRSLSTWASVLLLGGAMGTAAAQEWTEYKNQPDSFSTTFPAPVTVREIEWPSEYGAVFPARVHEATYNGRYYSVTVVDYRDAFRIHQERTNKTEADAPEGYEYWRIDILASVDYAAYQFRQRGGEITFDAWAHIDRVPGHQLQITNPDNSRTYAGIYLHEDRLYIIEATVPAGAPPQGLFQQALSFIDENGQRIRYDWDENHHLVRAQRGGQQQGPASAGQ
jgi:YD repeat-containing protein